MTSSSPYQTAVGTLIAARSNPHGCRNARSSCTHPDSAGLLCLHATRPGPADSDDRSDRATQTRRARSRDRLPPSPESPPPPASARPRVFRRTLPSRIPSRSRVLPSVHVAPNLRTVPSDAARNASDPVAQQCRCSESVGAASGAAFHRESVETHRVSDHDYVPDAVRNPTLRMAVRPSVARTIVDDYVRAG